MKGEWAILLGEGDIALQQGYVFFLSFLSSKIHKFVGFKLFEFPTAFLKRYALQIKQLVCRYPFMLIKPPDSLSFWIMSAARAHPGFNFLNKDMKICMDSGDS